MVKSFIKIIQMNIEGDSIATLIKTDKLNITPQQVAWIATFLEEGLISYKQAYETLKFMQKK